MAHILTRHRNLLLVLLLTATMLISCLNYIRYREGSAVSVSIPLLHSQSVVQSALERFRAERDETAAADMAVLRELCAQESLDARTREDAATQLQRMIDRREKQLALEGALTQSGLSPCAAVVTEGSVTIVTEKRALSSGENALVLALAQQHAGVEPSSVRVITAENAK